MISVGYADMPRVDIDIDLFNQDETIHLGALLGDDDAWRYLIKLWAWGVGRGSGASVPASVPQGILRLSRQRLAEVVGYRGDPGDFFDAMVKSGWLVDVAEVDGCTQYRMRGFAERYARYFKEKKRLAKRYAGKVAVTDEEKSASVTQGEPAGVPQTLLGIPIPIPIKNRQTERETRAREEPPEQPSPPADNSAALRYKPADAVAEFGALEPDAQVTGAEVELWAVRLGWTTPGAGLRPELIRAMPQPAAVVAEAFHAAANANKPLAYLARALPSIAQQHASGPPLVDDGNGKRRRMTRQEQAWHDEMQRFLNEPTGEETAQ